MRIGRTIIRGISRVDGLEEINFEGGVSLQALEEYKASAGKTMIKSVQILVEDVRGCHSLGIVYETALEGEDICLLYRTYTPFVFKRVAAARVLRSVPSSGYAMFKG